MILIDTGDASFADKYLPVLQEAITKAGATGLEQIVVTHWHRDHVGDSYISRLSRYNTDSQYGIDFVMQMRRPREKELHCMSVALS